MVVLNHSTMAGSERGGSLFLSVVLLLYYLADVLRGYFFLPEYVADGRKSGLVGERERERERKRERER